jgi:predicted nucleotidyltransferase
MKFAKEKETEIVEKIIRYLEETYSPDAIIIYGSFADGSANEHSDFDALVMADRDKLHDSSVIDGTILDVFVYP